MKSILFSLVFILFIFSFAFIKNAGAQTFATSEAKLINVSYDLPWPGILPDNPLYLLKVIRDNVVNLFITDPLKKADYDLLMSDKRLVSARMLVDKGEYQLAVTTLSKAGNYFDEAIQLASTAKQQGENASPILDKLSRASQEHQKVIYGMEQKTKGDIKYNLELLQVRAKNFQDTVDVVRSQQ
jgi:Domain of unknown function (DUF5667)